MKRLLLVILVSLAVPLLSFMEPENDPDKIERVVIDAGHGGKDSGTHNLTGPKIYEKDVALAVALKLGQYIEENLPDVEVIYTRETDVFLELWERTQLANRVQCDVFISIHCNGVARTDAYGTESWVIGLHKTDAQLEVAKKENSVILMEENYEEKYSGFDPNDPISYINLSLNQSAWIDQSLELAANIQEQFRERVKRRDRGVKQAGFYVISRTVMPSVLVELGFLSNPAEKEFLKSEQNQDYMASAIYRAFKQYKLDREKGIDKGDSGRDEPIAPRGAPAQKEYGEAQVDAQPQMEEIKEEMSDLVYRVQLATLSTQVPLRDQRFNGLWPIYMIESDGYYKYAYGSCKTMSEAQKLKDEAAEKGFDTAFVVAYYKGDRISIDQARAYESDR